MLKVVIQLGADRFEFEGESPFAEVKPLAETFLAQTGTGQQHQIDALTSRLKVANDKLAVDINSHTP